MELNKNDYKLLINLCLDLIEAVEDERALIKEENRANPPEKLKRGRKKSEYSEVFKASDRLKQFIKENN